VSVLVCGEKITLRADLLCLVLDSARWAILLFVRVLSETVTNFRPPDLPRVAG